MGAALARLARAQPLPPLPVLTQTREPAQIEAQALLLTKLLRGLLTAGGR